MCTPSCATTLNHKCARVICSYWDAKCDVGLIYGAWKHGYANYEDMKKDPEYCHIFGMEQPKASTTPGPNTTLVEGATSTADEVALAPPPPPMHVAAGPAADVLTKRFKRALDLVFKAQKAADTAAAKAAKELASRQAAAKRAAAKAAADKVAAEKAAAAKAAAEKAAAEKAAAAKAAASSAHMSAAVSPYAGAASAGAEEDVGFVATTEAALSGPRSVEARPRAEGRRRERRVETLNDMFVWEYKPRRRGEQAAQASGDADGDAGAWVVELSLHMCPEVNCLWRGGSMASVSCVCQAVQAANKQPNWCLTLVYLGMKCMSAFANSCMQSQMF